WLHCAWQGMMSKDKTISQIEEELEARYNRRLALAEAQFEKQLEDMSTTIIAEVDELKDKLQKSYDTLTERVQSEREYFDRMHQTLVKHGLIKRKFYRASDEKSEDIIEDVDAVVRYVQMGKDFEKMIAPINEND